MTLLRTRYPAKIICLYEEARLNGRRRGIRIDVRGRSRRIVYFIGDVVILLRERMFIRVSPESDLVFWPTVSARR